jgi:aspartate/methionine/tyrosine aminotransferase
MTFFTFDLERWQSTWETLVRFNLSESGVHPLSISELLQLSGASLDDLAALRMVYNQSDGTVELRQAIAKLYSNASPDQITVTVGSSEANFVSCWTLIEPRDHVVVVTPTYMQTFGLAKNFGANVTALALHPEARWQLDAEEVARAVKPGTKLVVVTNPSNPTGQQLSNDSRAALLEATRKAGAWLLADEVYQGAERNGVATKSFWGEYERLLVVNGLSKAYGLPGLRIGWIVGPPDFKDRVVRRHDYTVIGPSPASDWLARHALAAREKILERTRNILNANWPILEEWLASFDGLFDWTEPAVGAICLARYKPDVSALDLVEEIRKRQDILLVPGDHFGMQQHVRFGYGNEKRDLKEALELLREGMLSLLRD